MVYFQITLIVLSSFLGVTAIGNILSKFGRRDLLVHFLTPIIFYSFGFVLRISKVEPLIDIGYYFTDISFLILYSIFSVGIIIGQIKYWKK